MRSYMWRIRATRRFYPFFLHWLSNTPSISNSLFVNAKMEASPTSIAPLLLLRYLFLIADKSFSLLLDKSKLLKYLRYLLVSSFLFFLRLLPSFLPNEFDHSKQNNYYYYNHTDGAVNLVPDAVDGGINGGVDSGIGRALSQLLTIVNNIPVSSRKYEVVRSLAERLIDENLLERNEALRDVNISVLSAAFARTLSQLEAVMVHVDQGSSSLHGHGVGDVVVNTEGSIRGCVRSLSRRLIRYSGDVVMVWRKGKWRDEMRRSGRSAEKLAAELLWLAQKMEASGAADEAVHKWSSASQLAWLSLTAEPRLQGSLVKISAFLIKQARVLGKERREESTKGQARVLGKEIREESTKEQARVSGKERREESTKEQQTQPQVKILKVGDWDTVNMLLLWIPLLCIASMGTDSPVLAVSERIELEKILGDIIEALEQEEDQEKVLALWLHHFTYCPSSDWPNLHGCYTRWCTQSRRSLLRIKSTA